MQSELFTRRIGCFKERELPCKEWKYDKAFAAVNFPISIRSSKTVSL